MIQRTISPAIIAAAALTAGAAALGGDNDSRAAPDWWSLQPVVRPQMPSVKSSAWITNPIDAFVLAKLEAKGLTPAPPADRRTLIRRLSFDLVGLPPTPQEVEAFVTDRSPDAYDKLVNRLLESPHYGERWARHWLDVIRFGESQGFERDKLRANSWPFRDWVIKALNDDMPYDEFVRLQIAGDVLRPDDPLAVAATGFLVAGPYDEVGQTQQSEAMKAVVRQDEMEDIVGVTGQTFLGLTVHCARCHDHKFDPITQVDYYRMVAALGGVRHGERATASEAARAGVRKRRNELASLMDDLKAQQTALEQPAIDRVRSARVANPPQPVKPPQPIAAWEFNDDFKDAIGSLHGSPVGAARLDGGRLVLDGKDSYVASEKLAADLTEKTLEAWVSLASLDQQGGGVVTIQTLDGVTFDSIVYGEREAGRWMAGSNGFVRTQSFGSESETEVAHRLVHVAIVYRTDQTITAYRDGRPYGSSYTASSLQAYQRGKAQIVFGLRHSPAGGNRLLAGAIDRARLYDRALTPQEIAASAGVVSDIVTDDEIIAQLSPRERARRNELLRDLSQLQTEDRLLGGGSAYAVTPKQPELCHVLDRGDTRRKRDVVAPGGIEAVRGPQADFALMPDSPDAERRVRLARWITDPRHPLAARVIVNRLWHHHFGVGIVDTPNDFGFSGGRPTHAELLDWLASELVAGSQRSAISDQPSAISDPQVDGWRLKHVHRLIVTSSAYRQSPRLDRAAARIDAGNRLLWRKAPLRLDAETLRDAVLAVAGELNPTMGGPSFQDFRTRTNNSQFYEPADLVGFAFQRRSIYRTWVRSGTNPFLDVFDCPDPSTTTPKRAVTTTPLQALSLLNDSFMLRMSDRLAERVERDAGRDDAAQVRRAYELCFGRATREDELAAGAAFVADHGLPAFCRVLFNSNEFLYVD
jgi:hypothetical protein